MYTCPLLADVAAIWQRDGLLTDIVRAYAKRNDVLRVFATLALVGINPHHWLFDYLQACAANAGEAPANLDPWLPWAMDDARLERLRHPVQPQGP